MQRTSPSSKSLKEQITEHANAKPEPEECELESCEGYIPTGSTLINLAVSDKANGGWGKGKVVNLVGDSNTGKTLLVLTGLMLMSLDPRYDNYRLIYDDTENALEMPVEQMFGQKLTARLEDPYGNLYGSEKWHSSELVEDVKNNVWKCLDANKPFVYILDSYDALTSRAEIGRQEKEAKGKPQNQDYPRGPAVMTETLRLVKSRLKNGESLFLVVSQTRDDINPITFTTKRRAGGNALKFYSSHEVWLAIDSGGAITRTVNEKKYTIGWHIIARSKRSKLTGKTRDVPMVCYTEYGVDDITVCARWLMERGFWSGDANGVNTNGFFPNGKVKLRNLVQWIELRKKTNELKAVVQQAWDDIESKLHIERPRRFEVEDDNAI